MENLYYSLDLPIFVFKSKWKLVVDPILDDKSSLVAKMGAFEKAGVKKFQKHPKPKSTDEAASQYDAICKWGWPGISIKEYYSSRIMRLLGLPAAPVQFIPFNKERVPFAALIHIIPSDSKGELWKLKNDEIQSLGIDPILVSRLKAFAMWASYSPGAEIGEFRITKDNIPFLVDHQDSLWINSEFCTPFEFPTKIDPEWEKYFIGKDQKEIAYKFWDDLTDAAKMLDVVFNGSPFSEFYWDHFYRMLTQRRP
jgi:hypothetical protein